MAYEPREGYGALFRNTEKKGESSPDYKGSIKIDGRIVKMNAWLKESQYGKYLSVGVQQTPAERENPPKAYPRDISKKGDFDAFSDDVPF